MNAGDIIRKINVVANKLSWEDCGNHCKKDNACNFWTYWTFECELLKRCTSPTSTPGYLKGHRKCPSLSK